MTALDTREQSATQSSSANRNSSSDLRPDLDKQERQEVERRVPLSAAAVHEVVRAEGERELERSVGALTWSALAAGLSMGFSLVAQGLLEAYLPHANWTPLVTSLGYSVGFLIVILGRQQLFTENTLTVILPLLTHPNRATFGHVARLWGLVLAANLVGTLLFASAIAHLALFPPEVEAALSTVAAHGFTRSFGMVLVKGIFAGWLIALMVWLLPAAETVRLHIIVIITYLVTLGGFSHIIAGSVDVLYLVNRGAVSVGDYLGYFLAPTLLGNVIGGVALVAALNFAQVVTEAKRDR